jgi:enoyl-CoA hydratase/carnithine racemase
VRRFGRATLNSSGTLNALSLDMIDRLAAQLTQWARDPRIQSPHPLTDLA